MLDPDKAYAQIAGIKHVSETEICPVLDALNRVLPAEIQSTLEIPPFSKATMDGFAIKRSDAS